MRKENGVFKTTLWVKSNSSEIGHVDNPHKEHIPSHMIDHVQNQYDSQVYRKPKLDPYGANPFQGLDNELI